MDKDFLRELIEEQGKWIRIYPAREVKVDPYEDEIDYEILQPIAVKAIVADLTFSQAEWKIKGITVDKAKEIILPKRYKGIIEHSYLVEIDEDFYKAWRVNGKMQIREEGEYIRIYIYQD